jgi:hypothetical protein
MKSYRKELWFHILTRRALVNITSPCGRMFERERSERRAGSDQHQAYLSIAFIIKSKTT